MNFSRGNSNTLVAAGLQEGETCSKKKKTVGLPERFYAKHEKKDL